MFYMQEIFDIIVNFHKELIKDINELNPNDLVSDNLKTIIDASGKEEE